MNIGDSIRMRLWYKRTGNDIQARNSPGRRSNELLLRRELLRLLDKQEQDRSEGKTHYFIFRSNEDVIR